MSQEDKKEMQKGIEELLKQEREKRNWTYTDILIRLKDKTVTEKDIKKWEVGLEYPDLDMIYNLSEIYEVSSADLIQAKNNSFEKGLNSVNMIFVKWICYLLNISIKAGIVLLIIFYIVLGIGSLMFFVSVLGMIDKDLI